jgi:hypothetical protein
MVLTRLPQTEFQEPFFILVRSNIKSGMTDPGDMPAI